MSKYTKYQVGVPGTSRHLKFLNEIQKVLKELKIKFKQDSVMDDGEQSTTIIFKSDDGRLENVVADLSQRMPVEEVVKKYTKAKT